MAVSGIGTNNNNTSENLKHHRKQAPATSDRVRGGALISTGLTILSIYSFLVFAVPFFEANHLIHGYIPGPIYLFGIPALIFTFSFVYAAFFVGYCMKRGETPF